MAKACPICDAQLERGVERCANCGAPADVSERAESGARAECPECGGVLWSLAERCSACGARGYPALRPRFGDKSIAGPDE